ncbi:hypothetical protein vseg_021132 [Gypsophila vaccaria]
MEYFSNAKYVRLRSHHNKFLVAGRDGVSVKQSRDSKTVQARWAVELVHGNAKLIRLRSCYDKFLTASDESFLLGWTGKKVVQSVQNDSNTSVHWEPIGEASFYIKLRAHVSGKYLRANFGAPPWRNTVTVDMPEITATQDWVMWVVDVLDDNNVSHEVDRCVWNNYNKKYKSLPQGRRISNNIDGSFSISNDLPRCSTSSSSTSEAVVEDVIDDPIWDVNESRASLASIYKVADSNSSAMELFKNAKTVRLRSHHDKYLMADDDKESVIQDRNGGSRRARWTVEHIKSGEGVSLVRLRSCYDKYLTAVDDEFLLGVRGKKVKQTTPARLNSSIEWEPLRDGAQVKLKTRYGNFLRANGGVPPWRNSITHDIPSRSHTQDWILWKVDVLEYYPKVEEVKVVDNEKAGFERCESEVEPFSFQTHTRSESSDSGASGAKTEGRVIQYNVVDDNGNIVDEDGGERSIVFKGNGVEELTQSLEEETGLQEITLCTRSPLNGKLYPMRLALPPNHVKLHIYVVPSSSKG